MESLLPDYKVVYKTRLAEQFKNKPKLGGFIEAFIDDEQYEASNDLMTKRSLFTAAGKQLDGIGEIVGVKRPSKFVEVETAFGFLNDPTSLGFTLLSDQSVGGRFVSLNPFLQKITPIDDDIYRTVIQARIFRNSTNMSVDQTLNILSVLYGAKVSYFLPLNLNPMYEIGREFFFFERELIKQLPTTLGVGNITYSSYPTDEGFGFDGDDDALGFGDFTDEANGGFLASFI